MHNQVNYIFEHFFNSTIHEYELKPIPKSYNLNAYALLLWSYVYRDDISDDFKDNINLLLTEKKRSENFEKDWAKLPQLLAVDFLLNHNHDSLNLLLDQTSCEQSTDRIHFILSAGWLAPLIQFDNSHLHLSFEQNVLKRHGYVEENLLIIINSSDINQACNTWFENNLTLLKSIIPQTVECLATGSPILCNTFKNHFDEITIYVAERFSSLLTPSASSTDFIQAITMLSKHPMNRFHFALKGM